MDVHRNRGQYSTKHHMSVNKILFTGNGLPLFELLSSGFP